MTTTEQKELHTGITIRTFKGHHVDVFNPDPATIDIEDIAHGLSHVCRFGGHTRIFYSVAQHSIEVMKRCSQANKLAALLHDASEAYMGDMPRPIKRQLPDYKTAENKLMKVIAEKFGFEFPLVEEIKKADNIMLEIEHKVLMRVDSSVRELDVLHHIAARENFLRAFELLYIGQQGC